MNTKLPPVFWALILLALVVALALVASVLDFSQFHFSRQSSPPTKDDSKPPLACKVERSLRLEIPQAGMWTLLGWARSAGAETRVTLVDLKTGRLSQMALELEADRAKLIPRENKELFCTVNASDGSCLPVKSAQWQLESVQWRGDIGLVQAREGEKQKVFGFVIDRTGQISFRSLLGWCGRSLPGKTEFTLGTNGERGSIFGYDSDWGVLSVYFLDQLNRFQPRAVPAHPHAFFQWQGPFLGRPDCNSLKPASGPTQALLQKNLVALMDLPGLSREVNVYSFNEVPSPRPAQTYGDKVLGGRPSRIGFDGRRYWVETGSAFGGNQHILFSDDAQWSKESRHWEVSGEGWFAHADVLSPQKVGSLLSLRLHNSGWWSHATLARLFWADEASKDVDLGAGASGLVEDESGWLWREWRPLSAALVAMEEGQKSLRLFDIRCTR